MEIMLGLVLLLQIALVILNITVATRMVQIADGQRRIRTQVEEVNDYIFMVPEEKSRQRPESGLLDLPYPTVRPMRQPRE